MKNQRHNKKTAQKVQPAVHHKSTKDHNKIKKKKVKKKGNTTYRKKDNSINKQVHQTENAVSTSSILEQCIDTIKNRKKNRNDVSVSPNEIASATVKSVTNVKSKKQKDRKSRKHLNDMFKNKETTKKIKLTKRKKKLEQKLKKERIKGEASVDKPKIINSNDGNYKINVTRLEKMLTMNEKSIVNKRSVKKSPVPQSLRDQMMDKLRASRFRYINETLYTGHSSESKQYFKEDPDAFTAYHNGYKRQVKQWPVNPLDIIISSIKKMPKDYVIADFGCGEATLAASIPHKVHSFDFVSTNELVTACDMAHTPLLTSSVNVVVFCLALMGTNLNDYILEANRVLKKDGYLKIAEVESRFDKVEDFIRLVSSYGFVNTWQDLSHNLFYFMDFKKQSDIQNRRNDLPSISLKPCLYKKR